MSREFSLWIDGERRASESGKERAATSPATGEEIARVPDGTRADVRCAAAAAADARGESRETTITEREELLSSIADRLREERESLAEWLSKDQGKPLEAEAYGEVDGAIAVFEEAASAVTQLQSDVLPGPSGTHQYTRLEPHGVLGVITPWNFPVALPAEHISAGLAAGNTIVWAPAPTTSAVGLVLADVICEVVPDGVVNVVTGEGPVVGDQIVTDENVHAIGFTGSPETGRTIRKNAGLKPTILELGGNGPVVIADDADLEAAIEATAFSCFNNAGQVCSASEQVVVESSIVDEVREQLVDATEEYKPGDPMDPRTRMGPLNNSATREKVRSHLTSAVDEGATVLTGGPDAIEEDSLFVSPTIVDDVPEDTQLMTEETFGPVVPITTVDSIDEAIERTNADKYGLVASIFTRDIERAHKFVEGVHSGLAKVNEGPQQGGGLNLPYGGYTGTESGIGRLGGRYGIESYSQTKSVVFRYTRN